SYPPEHEPPYSDEEMARIGPCFLEADHSSPSPPDVMIDTFTEGGGQGGGLVNGVGGGKPDRCQFVANCDGGANTTFAPFEGTSSVRCNWRWNTPTITGKSLVGITVTRHDYFAITISQQCRLQNGECILLPSNQAGCENQQGSAGAWFSESTGWW